MAIVQLPSPALFAAGIEKRWDEVDPFTQAFVAPNAFVSGVPWRYQLDDTVQITVNETGRTVKGSAKGFADEVDQCIGGQMSSWRFPVPKDKDGEATEASFAITLQLVPD